MISSVAAYAPLTRAIKAMAAVENFIVELDVWEMSELIVGKRKQAIKDEVIFLFELLEKTLAKLKEGW